MSNGSMDVVFESEHILYVRPSFDLVPDYLEMLNDIEHVARFIGERREPYTEEEERSYMQNKMDQNATMFSMLEKESRRFIGNMEFMNRKGDEAEWGIVMTRRMQDRGYGTEALRTSIEYGFRELGLRRIYLAVYTDNPRAIHVYEKCGFREYDRNDVDVFMEIIKEDDPPVRKAQQSDAESLVQLRIDYLREDHGCLDEKDVHVIMEKLPAYFAAHLNKDLVCYMIREEDQIVSCAFLLIVEKPMSPAFINGKTGTVLNVYTRPSCRHKGYARRLINELISDAKKMDLCTVELKATDAGYALYRSAGFADDNSKYHPMKWTNPR